MRLVFAGTPAPAWPSLRALLDSRHEVVAVLTRPPARRGRGRRSEPSPVAALAAERGLEVLAPARPGEPETLERLRALAPDCCPVVAYGALLGQSLLDVPALGWVNLHFSLLPAWRGAAPVQHALLHGDEVTGATTFRLVRELDAGPTYGTLTEPVGPSDTAGDLLDRLAAAGARLLVDTLDHLEQGDLAAVPQPSSGVSLAPKVDTDDARVRWAEPAFAVDRRIRACTPAPGAWTTLAGQRLGLGPVLVRADATHLAPGELEAGKRAVLVGTGAGAVQLGEVRPSGRRPVAAADWARGARPEPGTMLGEVG